VEIVKGELMQEEALTSFALFDACRNFARHSTIYITN